MGRYVNGSLFYGISFEEPDEEDGYHLPWMNKESDYDFEEWFIENHTNLKDPSEWEDRGKHEDEWDAYYQERHRLLGTVPVEIGFCRFDEEYLGYIAVKGVNFSYDEGLTQILPEQLAVQPDWDRKIKDFCEKYGIPYMQPTWNLVLLYG